LLSQILAQLRLNGAIQIKIHTKKALYDKNLAKPRLWINHCGNSVAAIISDLRMLFHKTGIRSKF